MTLGQLCADLLRETLRDPRLALRRLVALDLPLPALWEALLAVVALNVLLMYLGGFVLTGGQAPMPEPPGLADPGFGSAALAVARVLANPLMFYAIQVLFPVLGVALIVSLGRACGGTGTTQGAVAAVTWLMTVMLALSVVQFLAEILLPPLAGLIALGGVVVFFMLATQYLCEIHGFTQTWAVFGALLAGLFGLFMVMALVLSLVFASLPAGVPDV